MIQIHATWKPGADSPRDAGLFLWGELVEDLELDEEDLAELGDEFPSGVPPRGLRSILRHVADGLLYECSEESTLKILWPTTQGRPVWSVAEDTSVSIGTSTNEEPSPGTATATAVRTPLHLWQIDGLRVPAQDAAAFLTATAGAEIPDVTWAPSVGFWRRATTFCMDLIGRGRFVPTLVEESEGGRKILRAVWKPVLAAEEDRSTLQELSGLMPPVCVAWQENTEVVSVNARDRLESIDPSRKELLRGFIETTTDTTLRMRLAEAGFPDRGRRKQARTQGLGGPLGAWLRSLAWIDDRIEVGTQSIEDFGSEVRRWNQTVIDPEAGSYRLLLKLKAPAENTDLHEPSSAKAPWKIEFFIQSGEDPALQAPAAQLWKSAEETLRWQGRQFPHAQERFLADLDRAARIFPAIEPALLDSIPTHSVIDVSEAYGLLLESSVPLKAAGFGIELPSWWQGRAVRPELQLFLRPLPGTDPNTPPANSLLEYDWEVALGDSTLSANQFHDLAASKQPLVRVGGKWIELRPEDTRILDAVLHEREARPHLNLAEALRLGLGGQAQPGSIPPPQIHAEGWIATLLEQVQGKSIPESINPGDEFKGTLRPYQERGLGWMAYLESFGFGGCLADDMGLGKTIQLIGLLLHERREDKKVGPTLVLAPMSVVGNWQREIQRFAPKLRVLVHHGLQRMRDHGFRDVCAAHDVIVSTYALARRDQEQFQDVGWHRVVLDEAQNIKNPTTQQSRAVRALPSTFRMALTGTPLENRLSELWSIFDFLNPGYLGSLGEFRRRFAKPIEKDGDLERRNLLGNLTRPFLLRRLKTDPDVIRDLPEKLEMRVFTNLTEEQAGLYQAMVDEMLGRIESSRGMTRRGLILTTLTRLKQICNHPRHYLQDGSQVEGRSGKVERLAEMLEEILTVGDRALCFTQFTEMGSILKEHLSTRLGVGVSFLHGGTAQLERDRLVEEFQTEKGPPIFILSVRAGGTGLNLTAANHVFHFDRWWNPAVENQATDRAFRIGQKRNVQVHKFVCVGTLEERIDQVIEEKKNLADLVLGAGENWLTELSTDQLRDVLTLSRDAVSIG